MPAALTYEQIVAASYRGILRREPDPAALHYVSGLESGSISLNTFFEFLTSLPEFYERCQPSDRKAAIASLYADGALARGNPDIFPSRESNLIFWHFPKCAGTAFKVALASQFHPLQLGQWSGCGSESMRAPREARQLFAGHMTWGEFTKLPRPAKVITLFRDPAERLESLFRFFTTIAFDRQDRYQSAIQAAHKGQSVFFTSQEPAIINVVNNGVVRDLADAFVGLDGVDPLREQSEYFVDLAFERVMEFDAVAFVDEIRDARGRLPPRMSRVLCEYFGTDIGPLNIINKTNSRIKQNAVASQMIEQNTQCDRRLFTRIRESLGT